MKKLAFISAVAIALASCNTDKAAEATTGEAQEVKEVVAAHTYTLDEGSVVAWRGFKTYTGSDHIGTVNASGAFSVEGDAVVGGKITIDMTSITNLDIEDEGKRAYLVGHLASPDFFDVANHPEATFEISSVDAGVVKGNLTIRGTTHGIEFPATVEVANGSVSFDAPTFTIDRTKWGVKFHDREDASIAESLKEDLIDHSIELTIAVTATK